MLNAVQTTGRAKAKDGQPRHHRANVRRTVPSKRSLARTPLNQAAQAYYLWHASYYPGMDQGLFEMFGRRVKKDTIRKWRAGKRKAPLWARQLLREAIEKRIAELIHGRDLLG